MPHGALDWRTPDEVYFGRAEDISSRLAIDRRAARETRLTTNRADDMQNVQREPGYAAGPFAPRVGLSPACPATHHDRSAASVAKPPVKVTPAPDSKNAAKDCKPDGTGKLRCPNSSGTSPTAPLGSSCKTSAGANGIWVVTSSASP